MVYSTNINKIVFEINRKVYRKIKNEKKRGKVGIFILNTKLNAIFNKITNKPVLYVGILEMVLREYQNIIKMLSIGCWDNSI